jgi:hypothetical protein
VLVSRVEDEVLPRPEQVGRQRDHDEPRTARLPAQVGHTHDSVIVLILPALKRSRTRRSFPLIGGGRSSVSAYAEFTALGVPAVEPEDDWVPSDLADAASFTAGPVTLSVPRHDGGSVDWWSVTAKGPDPATSSPPTVRTSYPTRASIPGGPLPRWWQIEDHRLDPGAVHQLERTLPGCS